MDFSFLSHLNYMAIALSVLVFFVIGAVWFSLAFGKMWVQELSRHNVFIQEPSQRKLMVCMGLTMLQNVIVSFAMACMVHLTNSITLESGVLLGVLIALGFSASAIGGVFIWESRSVKLFLIDAGYQAVGVIVSAIILSVWH